MLLAGTVAISPAIVKSLSLVQVRRLNDSAQLLYSEAMRGDFESAVAASMGWLVPAEIGIVGLIDGRTGLVTGRCTPEVARPEETTAGFNRWSHQHPAMGRRTRQAQSISQYLSRREWHRRELFGEVFQPCGLDDDLGLEVDLGSRVFLFVGRLRARRSFTREDRILLSLARTHLRAAWQQSRAALRLPLPRAVEQELGQGIVELDAPGRVLACGQNSNELLRAYFGADSAGAELPGPLCGWFRNQQAAVLPQPFRIYGARGRLTIRHVGDADTSRHFLIFHEERLIPDATAAAKLHALGLRPREQEVLFWVAQGKTNGEVAELLWIKTGTVKRHLENIYARLGVENRYGATLRALQCLQIEP